MPTINEYEVELKITNNNTKEVKLVTRTEFAYSVLEAAMQANLQANVEAGSAEVTLVRAGPPTRLITAVKTNVDDLLTQLIARGKK